MSWVQTKEDPEFFMKPQPRASSCPSKASQKRLASLRWASRVLPIFQLLLGFHDQAQHRRDGRLASKKSDVLLMTPTPIL